MALRLLTAASVVLHSRCRAHRLPEELTAVEIWRVSAGSTYTTFADSTSPPVEALAQAGELSLPEIASALVESVAGGTSYRLIPDHYIGANGIAHVNFKQVIGGIDVDNADFNIHIAPSGTIFSYSHSFLDVNNTTIPRRDELGEHSHPIAALARVSRVLDLPIDISHASDETALHPGYVIKGCSGVNRDPVSSLVYLKTRNDEVRLTWRIETDTENEWLLSYVDALTVEEIVGVVSYSADATYEVYPWQTNDPSEGGRRAVAERENANDTDTAWHRIGDAIFNTTRGNNAIAQENPSGGDLYLDNYRPRSATLDFQYDYESSMDDPAEYVNASITQLFYTANRYHDLLYQLGFTESAGNFQASNGAKGGVGGDAVILNAQDGSGVNNANFATPPDGQPGRMRMYIWGSIEKRDASFDASVVIHEYTHGLSTRLTGGPANSMCLNALESGGMGEGWSDFMATAVRVKTNDTRSTAFAVGAWVSNNRRGLRQYLYSTDLATNPYTYADVDQMDGVHAIGTIWATLLYEVLWNLADKHGLRSDNGVVMEQGVPVDGRYLAMRLIMDGMALQPCNPDFLQARDAIIDADTALTKGANRCELWRAFAKRGLGAGAKRSASGRENSFTPPSGAC